MDKNDDFVNVEKPLGLSSTLEDKISRKKILRRSIANRCMRRKGKHPQVRARGHPIGVVPVTSCTLIWMCKQNEGIRHPPIVQNNQTNKMTYIVSSISHPPTEWKIVPIWRSGWKIKKRAPITIERRAFEEMLCVISLVKIKLSMEVQEFNQISCVILSPKPIGHRVHRRQVP